MNEINPKKWVVKKDLSATVGFQWYAYYPPVLDVDGELLIEKEDFWHSWQAAMDAVNSDIDMHGKSIVSE